MTNQRILLYSGLAYLFSLVDDSPVNADQLLGYENQIATEAILHVLTILFLFLALREAGSGKVTLVEGVLGAVAFLVSALDDFPQVRLIDYLRSHHWYLLDVSIHLVSVLVFYVALRDALRRSRDSPDSPKPERPS